MDQIYNITEEQGQKIFDLAFAEDRVQSLKIANILRELPESKEKQLYEALLETAIVQVENIDVGMSPDTFYCRLCHAEALNRRTLKHEEDCLLSPENEK